MPGEWRDGSGIIVTESTARKLWPGQDPLGKTLREDGGRGAQHAVIGVAKDAQVSHLGESDTTYLYFPAGPKDDARSYLLVRFKGSFADIARGVQDAGHSLDADVPVAVTKLEDNLESWRTPSRIAVGLSGVLGGLALLLALIGVYGMVSYSVSRSVREIGIRMALGADGSDVLGHVLRQAMRPVVIGAVVGVAGCAAVSWVFSEEAGWRDTRDNKDLAGRDRFVTATWPGP